MSTRPLLLCFSLATIPWLAACGGHSPEGELDIDAEPADGATDVALDAIVRITVHSDDVALPGAGPTSVFSLLSADGDASLCTDVTAEADGDDLVLTCEHAQLAYGTAYTLSAHGLLTADGKWTWPSWSSSFSTAAEPPEPTPAKVRWLRVVPARSMAGGTAVAEFRFDRPVPGVGTPTIDAWTPTDEDPEIGPCEFLDADRTVLRCELELAMGCLDTMGYALELVASAAVEPFLTTFNTGDDPFDYPGELDSGCWPTYENEDGALEDFAELEVVPHGLLRWRFVAQIPDLAQANVFRDRGGTEGVAVSVRIAPIVDGPAQLGGIGLQINPSPVPDDLVALTRFIGLGTSGTPFEGLTAYVTSSDDSAGAIYVPDPAWWKGTDTDALDYLCVVVHDRQVTFFVSEDGQDYTRLTAQNMLLDAHGDEITDLDHPWECPAEVEWCSEGETLDAPLIRLLAYGSPAAPGEGLEPAFDHVRFRSYPLTGTAEDCPGPMDRTYD